VSIGNDVVDLDDPESRLGRLHRRWSERVFCPTERRALEASRSRQRLHWAIWAAKESAYKALKRLAPDAVFSPREFEVELSDVPATGDGVAVGRVVHRGRAFALEVHLIGASVHALAASADERAARLLWTLDEVRGDPGTSVRVLAARAIGRALAIDPAGVGIVGRPPVATFEDGRSHVPLSLSHHGRFAGFACTLRDAIGLLDPTDEAPPERQRGEASPARPPGIRALATSAL
jgi:hypothetical protein